MDADRQQPDPSKATLTHVTHGSGPDADGWLSRVCAGSSSMGAIVQAFDWASTTLGPTERWSIGLRSAVSTCLTSRFPMLVMWGPELIKIYNDGYRLMLGTEKHPRALGSPATVIWPEIWDVIGPMVEGVLVTGQPTWVENQLLVLERNGFPEECCFTYSYSPLFDDDGTIRGVLTVATETTEHLIAERRLVCLTDLSAALFEAQRVTDVLVRAATTLTRSRADIVAADFYLRVGDQLALISSNRRLGVSAIEPGLLSRVACDRVPSVLGGSDDRTTPAGQFVAPIGTIDGTVEGAFVAALNPRRPFDDAYLNFVQLIATTVEAALRSAFHRSEEVNEYRLISDTLQRAMLRPAIDLPTVAARYLPAVGNLAVGGDWYDVIDLGVHGRALVVGDCVGHGLAAATVMAQLRSATRAMLLDGSNPAATLDRLDLFAATIDGAYCATVVCAIVDRQQQHVTYSRAGHPPPLIMAAAGTTWLDMACGAPLGVRTSQRRDNAIHSVCAEDVIVMYSDGLIERRGENLDIGLERLAKAASTLYGSHVQGVADGLLRHLQPENIRDDVVLVVKHLSASESRAARTPETTLSAH